MGKSRVTYEQYKDEIDNILARLKYPVSVQRIITWLENFEKEDHQKAFELLFFLEYIPANEIQLRFNELITQLNQQLPEQSQVIFYPICEYAKSGDLMMYFVKKTPVFSARNIDSIATRDLGKNKLIKGSVLVLVDDFIGTGKSFIKSFKKDIEPWLALNSGKVRRIYLCSIVSMAAGKRRISIKKPLVRQLTQVRNRALIKKKSPFLAVKPKDIRDMADKYTSHVTESMHGPLIPYGYGKSQSLVAFNHGTPNNTLPMIWTDQKWKPIFPRTKNTRMKHAKELKKNLAFYMGIINKLELYLFDDFTLTIGGNKRRKYNPKIDYRMLAVMRLMDMKYDNIVICQILGITSAELVEIKSYRRAVKGYFTVEGEMTHLGLQFYKGVMSHIKKIEQQKINPNIIREDNTYMPKSFNGRGKQNNAKG
jgi:hypothetical protein